MAHKFKAGDKVVWYTDLSFLLTVRRGTVTGNHADIHTAYVYVLEEGSKSPQPLSADFMWPASVADELKAIVAKRQELRSAYDSSMSLIYQLRNKISTL